jgi:hypothetical protein
MDTRDNLYVNAADICLSMEYLQSPPPSDYIEIRAQVYHPVRTINLDEYTQKVQDDMMVALHDIISLYRAEDRKTIIGNGKSSVMTAIVDEVPGHELMERYEKWKSDEENKLLREQIESAKKLLRENGFKVTEV